MRAIGRDPVFIDHAAGAEITDVDGNTYVDYVCSWGPMILGHAHPAVVEAVTEAAALGTSYGAPTPGEVELAELVTQRMPGVDMLRMTSSGTEASMSAIRLARAATGRETLVKFAGAYHGHVDGLLGAGRLGPRDAGHPSVAGRAGVRGARHGRSCPGTTRRRCAPRSPGTSVAAILAEPYPANMGVVPPAPRLPRAAARARRPSTARCSCSTR